MPELTEGQHKAEFIVTEANGSLSRETVIFLSGQSILPGHVLGKVLAGSGTAVAVAGNTGNGTVGAVTVNGSAKKVIIKSPVLSQRPTVGNSRWKILMA